MSFDRLAIHYRWMECVLAGNKLQRCRIAFLGRVPAAQNVLIAGEGNGRFLLECQRMLPVARTTVVDASALMLRAARNRLVRHGLDLHRVELVHSPVLRWAPEGNVFDLIVTHFFLDCFGPDELKRTVGHLASAAAPDAAWLLADFQMPGRGPERCRAQIIHAIMYAFFQLVARLPARRLTPPDASLAAHGFRLLERQNTEWNLLHSDFWARSSV